MKVLVSAESQLVTLVTETADDAFSLGKLANRLPKAVCLKTVDGHRELQTSIAELLGLVLEQ